MTMKPIYTFLSLLAIFATTNSLLATDDSLLSIVQVFRHGERTPLLFYPKDPYKDKSYWNGLGTGQLTDNGKVQLVELGQYFRNRYGDFVSPDYSENEIYVYSVNTDRNYLSAESFLSGLYPNNNVLIPIHKSSVAVMGEMAQCLRYDILFVELELGNGYFKNVSDEYAEVYDYITENSGFSVFELLTGHDIWDTLFIEDRVGYTLPDWTNQVFPEKLNNLSNIFALSLCYTEEQQRLIAGPFLNELINHFERILSNPSSTEKVQLYSAHDVNIACFLNTFEAFPSPHIPDFASSLTFELRQLNEINYINAYYKQYDEAIPVTFRGCDFNCSLEEFKEIFNSTLLTEEQWDKAC